ncbi:PREDICTED: zinc finger protein ZAT1-like isoform X1 [Ipomoea nil]|uniref:zinc finger protein ZAT1-like isoform X1 n=1 Tax=Ipomoea nil TaxID=35883 RepID=UPI000900ABED|nr:PREDICTED: zinc finger protein ZAT1-like isoform X1 [Ipomoea nil]
MGEVQEPKFFCKFCNKACFTGKSLGGHMRCHLDLIAAAKKQKLKPEGEEDLGVSEEAMGAKNQEKGKKMSFGESGDQASYGLREKPLKSWKVSDPKHCGLKKKKKDLCKECGKRFPSVKALAGHLKCHSRKGSEVEEEEEEEEHHLCKKCGKGFDSIRALYGHMKIHSKRSRPSSNGEESAQSLSDLETMCPVRKKRSTIRYKLTSSNPPLSAVSEFEEVQDAAMCLMMISRGVKTWNEFVSANCESPPFFCKEEMPNSSNDYDDKDSISWKNISEFCSEICVNGCIRIEPFKKPEMDEPSFDLHYLEMGETSTSTNCWGADSEITAKVSDTMEVETVIGGVMAIPESGTRSREHACPVCFKVFQSGQALGGHKRAHYSATIETKVKKENLSDIHEFLDLNLPVNAATGTAMDAAMEERLWCIGSAGLLISN